MEATTAGGGPVHRPGRPGAVLGARSLWRQITASGCLPWVDSLALALPSELEQAAGAAGLSGRVCCRLPRVVSFAYGALQLVR